MKFINPWSLPFIRGGGVVLETSFHFSAVRACFVRGSAALNAKSLEPFCTEYERKTPTTDDLTESYHQNMLFAFGPKNHMIWYGEWKHVKKPKYLKSIEFLPPNGPGLLIPFTLHILYYLIESSRNNANTVYKHWCMVIGVYIKYHYPFLIPENQRWNFRTIYGGHAPSRNRVVVPARQAT